MAIKNIKTLLAQVTEFPAAIEARLPAGAPKVSTMLLDVTGSIPTVPDFPVDLPDLPTPPEIPAMPELPGLPAGLSRNYVSNVEVRPVATEQKIISSPSVGVIPEVRTRRGM